MLPKNYAANYANLENMRYRNSNPNCHPRKMGLQPLHATTLVLSAKTVASCSAVASHPIVRKTGGTTETRQVVAGQMRIPKSRNSRNSRNTATTCINTGENLLRFVEFVAACSRIDHRFATRQASQSRSQAYSTGFVGHRLNNNF